MIFRYSLHLYSGGNANITLVLYPKVLTLRSLKGPSDRDEHLGYSQLCLQHYLFADTQVDMEH